jgi:hypothetical protein
MKDQASKGFDKLGKNAEKSLDKAGSAGKKAGGKIGRGMKVGVAAVAGIGAQLLKAQGSFGEVGDAALDAATAAATGFAVGGPVGAALAGGVSLLTSWWEHEQRIAEEAEAAKEALIEMASASRDRMADLDGAMRGALDSLRKVNAELAGESYNQAAVEAARERAAAEKRIVELREAADLALQQGTAEGEAAFDQLNAEADKLQEIQNITFITAVRQKDLVRQRKQEADEAARLKEEAKEILQWEKERAAELKKESDELDAIAEKEAKLFDDLESALERTTEQYEKQSEELGSHLALYKRLIAEGFQAEAAELKKAVASQKERKALAAEQLKLEKEVARELKKQAKEQERFNEQKRDAIQAVRDEIELLDARNDEERQAIEDERERIELLEKGVSLRDIEMLQSARRAKEAREAADAAGDEADARERGARAEREGGRGRDGGGRDRRGSGPRHFGSLPRFGSGGVHGAVFVFGGGGGPRGPTAADVNATAAGQEIEGSGGFRIASLDEQAADRRRMEQELGIQRDERGRRLGFEGDPLTRIGEGGEEGFDVDGEFQSKEEFEKATEALKEAQEQAAEAKEAAAELGEAITEKTAADKEAHEALRSAAEEAKGATEDTTGSMDKAREATEGAADETVKLADATGKLADASTKGLEKTAQAAADALRKVEEAEERIAAVEAILAEF